MNNFDVAICVDEASLNGIIASLYGRQSLRNSLFRGTQSISDPSVTVSYDVLQPPTVSLNPPSPQQWQRAIKADGNAAAPVEHALVVHFPQVKVAKQQAETTVAFDAICTAGIANNALSITPLAAVVDLSGASALDQLIYKKVLIPRVLGVVGSMLSGKQLPDVNFQGTKFGQPALVLGNGMLAAVANLAGRPAPSAPALETLPGGRFSVLLSHDAMQQVAARGTQDLRGKSTGASGSQSFGIGKASYNATVRLENVSASVTPGNLTQVNASVRLSVSASAGVDVIGEIIDTIGDGIKDVGNAIGDAFSSY